MLIKSQASKFAILLLIFLMKTVSSLRPQELENVQDHSHSSDPRSIDSSKYNIEGFSPGVYEEIGEELIPVEDWLIVQFPQAIKDQLDPPSWLKSWEEAEFAAKDYDVDDILGGKETNVTLRAAYHVLSHCGGVWLGDKYETRRQELIDAGDSINDDVLHYFSTDDEETLRKIHRKLGLRR